MLQESKREITSKIIALLQLLDDESPVVRNAVTLELRSLERDVFQFVHDQRIGLNDRQYAVLDVIFRDQKRAELLREWQGWLDLEEGAEKLENALCLLTTFQNGSCSRLSLSASLDELARLFPVTENTPTSIELIRFLFDDLGFASVPNSREDKNSVAISTILETRRGPSMVLLCICMLLGHRLGMEITGCRWLGDYYVWYRENGILHLVDLDNHGTNSTFEELLRLQGPSRRAAEAALTLDMNSTFLVRCVVNGYATCCRQENDFWHSTLAMDLISKIDRRMYPSLTEMDEEEEP